MKKIFLFSCFFISLSAVALVRTVSNSPATLAQFNTIQAAIDASSGGDSIYVHGSPNNYASFTITDKQLTIIGPGWAPNKNLPFTANVNGGIINGAASSGTEINGLNFIATINIQTGVNINNIRFIRNYFSTNCHVSFSCCSGGTYTGYLFEGNVFSNAQVQARPEATYQNFLFQNNYFYENGSTDGNITGFQNSVNVLFNHNLWFGPGTGTVRNAFSNSSGGGSRFLSLTNNIFIHRDAANQNSFSTFNNNITLAAGNNSPWAVNSNVNGGGNISDTDPQMADEVAVNAGTNDALQNFTIAAGPANNTASDGKDIGLLYDAVGSLNWTTSRSSRLPFIFSMNITNPTIAAGGTLDVTVEARKNN